MMIKIPFCGIDDVANFIYYLASEQNKTIYTVLFYDEAKKLVQELLRIEGTEIDSIELLEPTYDGYDKEYYIALDNDLEISVEKAYHNNIYYRFGDDNTVVLLHGNANPKIVEAASYSNLFQIELCKPEEEGSEEDFECSDDECEIEMYEIDYNKMMEYVLNKLLGDYHCSS